MDDHSRANAELSEPRSGLAWNSCSKPGDEHHVSCGATSISPVPGHMHEPTTTQSPPLQVMDRVDEGFDRLPSSVFHKSKVENPADGSIASNDSLFSIEIGSNSFSGDRFQNLKSKKFFKDELFTLSNSPVASPSDPYKTSSEFDKISDYTVKDKTRPSVEGLTGEKPTDSPSPSCPSVETGISAHSFAFPVLEGGDNVVSKKEGDQHQQNQQKEEKEQDPCESAAPSKSSCFDNFSCFPYCRQKCQCCN